MGKNDDQDVRQTQHSDLESANRAPSRSPCPGCSALLSKFFNQLSFRCVFVLILSFSVLLPGIFWILPFRSINSGFDAKESIKLSATVQASFKLQASASDLVQRIGRLEYDISGELSIPDAKVAVLSIHQSAGSNLTNVVFGVIFDPINAEMAPLALGLLRPSLVELYLQETNLSLTTSIFGQPSDFEILKFSGGVTVIPAQSASIWQMPQILFNFTLNNSISEIRKNFNELKEQLEYGLNLGPHETIFVQMTNKNGSTLLQPVVVQASVRTDVGGLLPGRLKQLAQIVSNSPGKNLGLDNSIFGKVKSISLSTYLKGSLHDAAPTPSPAPSPEPSNSPDPDPPTHSPAPIQHHHHHHHHHLPCSNCKAGSRSHNGHSSAPQPNSAPHHSFAHTSSPSPSPSVVHSPSCPYHNQAPSPRPHHNKNLKPPAMSPHSHLSPHLSPLPAVSYGSRPSRDTGNAEGPISPQHVPSPLASSPTSLAEAVLTNQVWFAGIFGLLIVHLLLWSS